MFILKSKEQLEKAITKAKKIRTKVRFLSFGNYAVKGTSGNFYTVRCERTATAKEKLSVNAEARKKLGLLSRGGSFIASRRTCQAKATAIV
jgi:hypothetical protein